MIRNHRTVSLNLKTLSLVFPPSKHVNRLFNSGSLCMCVTVWFIIDTLKDQNLRIFRKVSFLALPSRKN